jgi:L-lactate dehydrogenase complex protein LldG
MSGVSGDGRSRILSAVRSALLVRGDEPGRRGLVRARLDRAPAGVVPSRARQPRAQLVASFKAMLEVQGTAVREVGSLQQLPTMLAAYLAEMNLPARLRHGADPVLNSLSWEGSLVECQHGPAEPGDLASLSRALAGASETGTLFLASGADNPSTLNFLPETHCVVIMADAIFGAFEEIWSGLRETYGKGNLPRIVNLVSGPSCSADIEQTIIRGAHGPRQLAVFIVGERH